MAKDQTVSLVQRKVLNALRRLGLATESHLILAVSGGPDSLAMLHTFVQLREVLKLSLHVAHLDHGLRGTASKEDAAFVAEFAHQNKVAYTAETADVAMFSQKNKMSLEEASRQVRYAFLAKVAAMRGADAIATAHTYDDQAETVLMHIIRGSGLAGLTGMSESTTWPSENHDCRIIRPMLTISRDLILNYCNNSGLEPRIDESNFSDLHFRNRIRMELIPLMEQYNPAIRGAFVRLSQNAERDVKFIESQVNEAWEKIVRHDESYIAFDRTGFINLPLAIQRHLIRRAIESVKGDLANIDQVHIDESVSLVNGPAGKSLDLPHNIRTTVSHQLVSIGAPGQERPFLPVIEGQHQLQVPGDTLLQGWRVTARIYENNKIHEYGLEDYSALLDYSCLGNQLHVRTRRAGDRFQPLGISGSQKLQDFMVNTKIPRSLRESIPLVLTDRGIAWVVGWRIADWAKVRSDGEHTIELKFLQRN